MTEATPRRFTTVQATAGTAIVYKDELPERRYTINHHAPIYTCDAEGSTVKIAATCPKPRG